MFYAKQYFICSQSTIHVTIQTSHPFISSFTKRRALIMTESTNLLHETRSSSFIPLLPAKAYSPLKPIKPTAPLIDQPVGDQVMPTDDMVQATATKSRSSSTSTDSSLAASTGVDSKAFLPLVELEE